MNDIIPLEDVFRGRLFNVPDFQRGYAWSQKNWDDLIEDIELLPEGRSHFTGTLVVSETGNGLARFRDESGASYITYDLIDGQQRLTSLVIFLDTIHDELERLGEKTLAEGLAKNFLSLKDRNGQVRSKLTLNRDCQDFFYNDVLGFHPGILGPQIRSHHLLLDAHEHFSSYLERQKAAHKKEYNAWLEDLYFKIVQHITLLFYPVENDLDAGVVFETMNDRGRPLTELEKVKNYLLYVATRLDLPDPHDLNRQINQTWTHIFEELMAAGLEDMEYEDQLLRMHWLMAYDYNPKNWQNSRSIKTRFNLRDYVGKHEELLGCLKEYLDSLKQATTAFCNIRNPKHRGSFNDISDKELHMRVVVSSEKLVRLGVRVNFLPLLMAVRIKADDDGSTYARVVELCEKVDFRMYQWEGYRAFAAQSTFFRLGYDYYFKPDGQRLVDAIIRTADNYCTNEHFSERFDLATENWYAWGGLKYFLYEYEQYLAQAEHKKPHYLWEEIYGTNIKRDTIEHILPQALEDPYWKQKFTPRKHKRWVHDIGNLTLTYDNSSLGAKSFIKKKGSPDKKNCYASSKLFIEQQLVQFQKWSEAEIIQRRKAIRDWAEQRWYMEKPVNPPPANGKVNLSGEERLLELAEEYGTSDEFKVLLDAVKKLPVYPRMQRNWRVVACTEPDKRNQTLFWIGPDLYVEFNLSNIHGYLNIPAASVHEIMSELGIKKKHLDPEEIDDFIAKLAQLFKRHGSLE